MTALEVEAPRHSLFDGAQALVAGTGLTNSNAGDETILDGDVGIFPGDSCQGDGVGCTARHPVVTGTLFVGLGLALFREAGLMTGGTVGLAFLAHYATGLNFGLLFFCINLPFYLLAWQRMGRRFTLKTLAAVSLLAGL